MSLEVGSKYYSYRRALIQRIAAGTIIPRKTSDGSQPVCFLCCESITTPEHYVVTDERRSEQHSRKGVVDVVSMHGICYEGAIMESPAPRIPSRAAR
ncbi:hypothetical protein HYZ97_02565 [Candidatus Pacearchaeota archaeon]|nr:hypothetical protein [Candidatus Pacearchaeota archaeon]